MTIDVLLQLFVKQQNCYHWQHFDAGFFSVVQGRSEHKLYAQYLSALAFDIKAVQSDGIEVYLAIICTFHYLQICKEKTELFAKNANKYFSTKMPSY